MNNPSAYPNDDNDIILWLLLAGIPVGGGCLSGVVVLALGAMMLFGCSCQMLADLIR